MTRSETRPGNFEEKLEWYPAYSQSRVNGCTYTPYSGTTEWEKFANSLMAEEAKANFNR